MAKTRDDYSETQIRGFHERLKNAASKEERAKIYKEMGASAQGVGQWFRYLKLPALGQVETGGAAKKRGRPAKAPVAAQKKGQKAGVAKRGRPKGSTKAAKKSPGAPSSAPRSARKSKGLGLSIEAKETLIRLLDALLSD